MLNSHRQRLPNPSMQYLDRHLEDAGQVELRGLAPGGKTASGIFNAIDPLMATIRKARTFANLYITVQRPIQKPVAGNYLVGSAKGLKNDDIESYIRLVFDLDAVRPTGTVASPGLVESCEEAGAQLISVLHRHGWPIPAKTLSGNGVHLTWRTQRMPNDDDLKADLKLIYAGLAQEIDNPEVLFDQTVRNPGRILRVPGSLNLKGGQAREVIVEIPSRWRQVSRLDVTRLANFYDPATLPLVRRNNAATAILRSLTPQQAVGGGGDYRTLDVLAWFTAHGNYLKPIADNKHSVRCPWSDQHTTVSPPQGGDSIIFESKGTDWPGFFCHHQHCSGRDIRQVMELWGDSDQFCRSVFLGGKNGTS